MRNKMGLMDFYDECQRRLETYLDKWFISSDRESAALALISHTRKDKALLRGLGLGISSVELKVVFVSALKKSKVAAELQQSEKCCHFLFCTKSRFATTLDELLVLGRSAH